MDPVTLIAQSTETVTDTGVTDAGLRHLERFTKLRRVRLDVRRFSDTGIERLQHALPNLQILR